MTVRILHAPIYSGAPKPKQERAVRYAFRLGVDSIGWAEMVDVTGLVQAQEGWRTVVPQGPPSLHRGMHDPLVSTRETLRPKGEVSLFGASGDQEDKFGPERWMNVSVFDAPGVGALPHIVLHPHAVVQEDGVFRHNARVGPYKDQMERFGVLLTFCQAYFGRWVVTGDVNFPDRGDERLSPWRVVRKHGGTAVGHGIDLIACSKGLRFESVRKDVAPKVGVDHPWLMGRVGLA